MAQTEVLIKVVVIQDRTILYIESDSLVISLLKSELLVFVHYIVRQDLLDIK